jgi:hypothetical protein
MPSICRRVVDQPDNLELVGYNLNDKLNDPDVFQLRAYDLIHSRFVAPGIKRNRWASYIRDMRILLRPGGWVQVAEYLLHIQSNSGRLTDQSAVYRWWQGYATSMTDLHRDPRIGPRLKEVVEAAGLRDVHVYYMRLRIGDWDPGAYHDCVACSLEAVEIYTRWQDFAEEHGQ